MRGATERKHPRSSQTQQLKNTGDHKELKGETCNFTRLEIPMILKDFIQRGGERELIGY